MTNVGEILDTYIRGLLSRSIWGSLRLAPINNYNWFIKIHIYNKLCIIILCRLLSNVVENLVLERK